MSHETYEEDLAAYALGALDDTSATRVEDHLAACARCRALLREYQEVARLLPLALPVSRPPAHARETLLERAGDNRRRFRLLPGRAVFASTSGRIVMASLAAVMALTIGFGAWMAGRSSHTEHYDTAEMVEALKESEGVVILSLNGSDSAPAAVGQLFLQPEDQQAGLMASHLPGLDKGYCFQLWFVRADGTRTSGGVFWPEDNGSAITLVDMPGDLSQYTSIGVTEEPWPGSPSPTGKNVLRGEL